MTNTYDDIVKLVKQELTYTQINVLGSIADDFARMNGDEAHDMWANSSPSEIVTMIHEQIDVGSGDRLYTLGLRPVPGNEAIPAERDANCPACRRQSVNERAGFPLIKGGETHSCVKTD